MALKLIMSNHYGHVKYVRYTTIVDTNRMICQIKFKLRDYDEVDRMKKTSFVLLIFRFISTIFCRPSTQIRFTLNLVSPYHRYITCYLFLFLRQHG